MIKPLEIYKNYEISTFSSGYTVFFEGEELYFDTLEDARAFIDTL